MSVFLRKQNLKKGVYLSFIEAFYDSKTKNTIQKHILMGLIYILKLIERMMNYLTEQNIKNIFDAVQQNRNKILN